MSAAFCPYLENSLVINNDSRCFTVAPCCYYRDPVEISAQESLQSQLTQLQKSWQDPGTHTQGCRTCLDQEAAGLHSHRLAAHEQIPRPRQRIQHLTVAVNKQCNLACATCSPYYSSFWYQENQRLGRDQPINIHQLHQQDRAGMTQKRFLERLQELDLSDLTYIKFGGGEPMMTDTHRRVLELIPCPDQVMVQYTSNFSIMPDAGTRKLWESFRLVKWMASVDGVGEIFSHLRWPHTWAKFQDFVNRSRNLCPANVMFGIEHTLNPLNIWYFDQLRHWFDQSFAHNRHGDASDFNIHVAVGDLGLHHTPEPLRAALRQRYGDHAIVKLLDQQPAALQDGAIITYLDHLDRDRGHQWRNIYREVARFFHD